MEEKPRKPKKALPRKAEDPGTAMGEIARKAASLSKQDMGAQKKATANRDPKPIPSPNAKKWLDKIKRSEKVRKPFMEDAERFLRMYQGDYSLKPSKRRNVDAMSVNMVYAYVETATPAIFSGFPYIRVRPKPKVGEAMEGVQDRARNMELVINYFFKELAVDDQLHDVLFDTFFGHASVELGWETEIQETEPTVESEDGADIDAKPVVTIVDRPFIQRLDRSSLFFDPDAKRRRDCRWIAIKEVIPYNDFIASSLYTERAKKKVKPQAYPKDDEEKNWLGRDEDIGDREWVELFTVWDKDTRKKFIVTKNYEAYVNTDDPEGEEWPYEMEYKGDPFPVAVHDAKRDHTTPYSWSEFKAVEPQIQEVNRLRAAIQVHVKRSLPKYLYTEDLGTKADVSKIMNARSDEAVKVDNLNAIKILEIAPIPPDIYKMAEMARDDYRNTSGMQEFQDESLAKTATEASIAQGNSEVRKSMRSKQWEQYVVEIAAKLAQLLQQNLDQSVIIEIAGEKGAEWLEVNKEQIKGEFWYDIEPGIMEYKNEATRKQQLLKFMELSQNNPNVNQRVMIGKVAQELDIEPGDVVIPENQMPAPPPPPPMLKFKELDPLAINDSGLMNMVVLQYLQQNGVPVTPQMAKLMGATPPGPPPGAGGPPPAGGGDGGEAPPPAAGGKDVADNGLNPNGNPGLPPVAGNISQV